MATRRPQSAILEPPTAIQLSNTVVTFARLYKLPVPAVLLIRILGVVGVVRKLSDVEADVDVVPAMTATNVYYSYLLCR